MKNKEAVLAAFTEEAELPNFIASNLKVLRKSTGWSQTELAECVGLNRGNIASYESGCAEPSINGGGNLIRVAIVGSSQQGFVQLGKIPEYG